jgi:mannose-6-phosphate isomerase-like protein (cupin superfamily)
MITRRSVLAATGTLAIFARPGIGKDAMKITRSGSQPSARGPAEYFSGSARVDSQFAATAGRGWVQVEGGSKQEINAGDIIWFPPGEKHWHGATSTTGMTHIAIAESLNGKVVDWLEKVTDEQYSQ